MALLLAPQGIFSDADVGCRTVDWSDAHAVEAFRLQSLETSRPRLGAPQGLVTDGEGFIFLADGANMRVSVYDASGRFLRHFGGRGRESGRFLSTPLLAVHAGRVVTADPVRETVSWWSRDGSLQRDSGFGGIRVWPSQLAPYEDDAWLMLYLGQGLAEDVDAPRASAGLLHLHLADFSERTLGFGEPRDLLYLNEGLEPRVHATVWLGRFAVSAGGTVSYAAGAYDGRLHRFRRSGRGFERVVLRGLDPGEPPIRELAVGEEGPYLASVRLTTRDGQSRRFAAVSETLGLFVCDDGTLVHLFRLQKGTERTIIVQAFSPSDEHLGSSEVEVLTREARDEGALHRMLGHDSRGLAFILRYIDGYRPEVRAFRFESSKP